MGYIFTAVCFPYEFTLLSNFTQIVVGAIPVCFPYEFTLLSNSRNWIQNLRKFVSPTNLHCSQTNLPLCSRLIWFVSPTNLHCSQTLSTSLSPLFSLFPLRIYTALKPSDERIYYDSVCFPYEFTLLSNLKSFVFLIQTVCFPYEFTLLSNLWFIKLLPE